MVSSPSLSLFYYGLLLSLFIIAVFAETPNQNAPNTKPKVSASELRKRGEEQLYKGEMNDAIDSFTALLAIDGSQINYHSRASAYLRKRPPSYSLALNDLSKALEKDSKFTKGRLLRAKVKRVIGECADAVEEYKEILKTNPNNKEALEGLPRVTECVNYINEADRLQNTAQFDGAKMMLGKAMEIATDSSLLLLKRSKINLIVGDYQSILLDTRRALQVNKADLDALLIRGIAHYRMNEYEHANNHFREGLRFDPEHKELKAKYKKLRLVLKYWSDAESSIQQGNVEEMKENLESLQSIIDADQTHPHLTSKTYLLICKLNNKLKEPKLAIEACNRALGFNPDLIDALIEKGSAHSAAGEYQDAINNYQAAAQKDPQNAAAQEGLRQAQVDLKRSQQRDYYKELGVSKDADQKTIQRTFRKLALQQHPDKFPEGEQREEAEKKFKVLAEAYDVLSDPEKRAKYDRGEDIQQQGGGGGNPFQHFNFGGSQQTFTFHFG